MDPAAVMSSPVLLHRFVRSDAADSPELGEVMRLGDGLLEHMNEPERRELLRLEAARSGGVSQAVQAIVAEEMARLGFRDEAKGLFEEYPVRSLRPDYYKPLGDGTGILFEVEKGKTLRNNMDLLDLWKTHLCAHAHHLWLMVPQATIARTGRVRERPYPAVLKRLSTFFAPRTEVDVRSCSVFGY